MNSRLASQRVYSFISHNSCSHLPTVKGTRSLVTCLQANHRRRKERPIGKFNPSSTTAVSHLMPTVITYSLYNNNQRNFHASTANLAPKDPYEVLGVKKDATAADIKKTYFSVRSLSHPPMTMYEQSALLPSWPVNTTPIRTQTKVQRRSS